MRIVYVSKLGYDTGSEGWGGGSERWYCLQYGYVNTLIIIYVLELNVCQREERESFFYEAIELIC